MAELLDWRTLPDDFEFASESAAERALGLPQTTIACWRRQGIIVGVTESMSTREPGFRSARRVTVGALRPGLVQYRPIHRTPATSFSDDELEFISVTLQMFALDATRSEKKRCDELVNRIARRDRDDEEVAS